MTTYGNGDKISTGETRYEYVGSSLAYQVTTNVNGAVEQELYFFYDASGNLSVIRQVTPTKDYHFYVTTNAQGDVLGIYSSTGTLLASYEYDAWGNCTIVTDNPTYNIGATNPIRYRGYYYDSETKLYYLQSRYYDPEIGRFLNSDNVTDSNAGLIGYNTFAYCGNNPVNACDPSGHSLVLAIFGKAVIGGLVGAAIGAGCNLIKQLKNNGGNWSAINKKELAIATAVGGITGALSGGFGKAIASATGSVLSKCVATVITEGVINSVGGTVETIASGDALTYQDQATDFAVGASTTVVSQLISSAFNHIRFNNMTKSGKRSALGNNVTNREIRTGAHYKTESYKEFLTDDSDTVKQGLDVCIELFED